MNKSALNDAKGIADCPSWSPTVNLGVMSGNIKGDGMPDGFQSFLSNYCISAGGGGGIGFHDPIVFSNLLW